MSADNAIAKVDASQVEMPCEHTDEEFNIEYAKVVKELEEYDEYSDYGDEPTYVDKFNTIVKHIRDNDFKYVAVCCRYTTRLDRVAIAKYAADIGAELIGMGGYLDSGVLMQTDDMPTPQYGEVLFKCNRVANVFKLTNHLMEYNHCGCFTWSNLYEFDTRDDVIVLKFDTESG